MPRPRPTHASLLPAPSTAPLQLHLQLAKAEGGAWWRALLQGQEGERSYRELLKEAVEAGGPIVWGGWVGGWVRVTEAKGELSYHAQAVEGEMGVGGRVGHKGTRQAPQTLAWPPALDTRLAAPPLAQTSRCSRMTSWTTRPRL